MSVPGAAVVAVSGSVGKSSTAAMTRAACDDDVRVVEVEGAVEDPVVLVPDVGVVTTLVGADEDLVGAVTETIRALPATATAVVNVDDPFLSDAASHLGAAVLRVSAQGGPGADLVAAAVRLDAWARARFGARTPWGDAEVALAVAGHHQVANALCALAAACAAGVDLATAVAGLLDADTPRGTVRALDGLLLLDDTGHATTVSVLAALDTLAAMEVAGRRVGVLGPLDHPGPAHETEHWRVGMRAARVLDRLVVVGESASPMTAGARDGAMPRVELVPDASAAVEALADLAPGDGVLVKGGRSSGLEAVVAGLLRDRETEGIVS